MSFDEDIAVGQRLREAYQALGPGPRAALKRCATRVELEQEGWYWELLREAGIGVGDRAWAATLVLCFPAAEARTSERFDLGAHLRRRIFSGVKLDELPARAVAFRRLLAARDRDDLAHQLRHLLVRAAQPKDGGARVDWGRVAVDVKYFGDGVRRRWAKGFYTADAVEEQEEGTGQ